MKVIYGIEKIPIFANPVVAMGVFDGIHCGHRKILSAAVKKANEIKGTSIALTFYPHPQKEKSLYSIEHRLRLIQDLGIDLCIVVNFNRHFAKTEAKDFIINILVNKIGTKYIYVGSNFKFGRGAQGDLKLLDKLGALYGFKAKGFKIIKSRGKPISSTLIRRLIKNGRIQEAKKLLGRPVSILGTVIKGTALGSILGFPTANINPHHEVIPSPGVYAVYVNIQGKKLMGACYVGRRPTLDARNKKIGVEVYIMHFNKNIYGKYAEIQFVKRIRIDKKFPSLGSLARQIRKDVFSARRILS